MRMGMVWMRRMSWMRRWAIACAAAVAVAIAVLTAAAQGAEPDWSAFEVETMRHFEVLLKADTTSPPGNEALAADYLRKVLEAEGIPVTVLADESRRPNLIARLKGNGTKRPLLLLGHTDVVTSDPARWTVPPFGARRENGYVRGRGAVDDKSHVVANLMVLLTLKRLRVPLDRDVVLLAEADEESGAVHGVRWLAEHHWSEIDAEYALAEGGGGVKDGANDGDRLLRYQIATAEKVARRVKLVARGSAGHGSIPRPDNAIARLAAAIARVTAWQPPIRLNDTTRAYFQQLSTTAEPPARERYRRILDGTMTAADAEAIRQHEWLHNAMLRTSISPTVLRAGERFNVIPAVAEATLDVRALPDEDPAALREAMRAVIGDPAVEVVPFNQESERPTGPPSRLDSDMYRALQQAQRAVYPGVETVPIMMTGATDMAFLRARGVQAYGTGSVQRTTDADCCSGHSDDEKIEERELHRFVRFTWKAVLGVASSQK